jgi:hypothetical protein
MKLISRILLATLLGTLSTHAYSKDSKKDPRSYQRNRLSDADYLAKIKNFKYFYNCPFGEVGTLLFSETESTAFPLFLTDLFDETLLDSKNVKMITISKTQFNKDSALFSFQLQDKGDITGHHIATIDYQLHLNDLAEEIDADSIRTDSDNNQINVAKQIKCTKLSLPKPIEPPPPSIIPLAMTSGRWKTLADCFSSATKQGTTYEYNNDHILIGKTYNIDDVLTHISTFNTIIDTQDPYLFIFKGSQEDLSIHSQSDVNIKLLFTENSYRVIESSYNGTIDIADGYFLNNHESTPVNYKCND